MNVATKRDGLKERCFGRAGVEMRVHAAAVAFLAFLSITHSAAPERRQIFISADEASLTAPVHCSNLH
jgi:hypothetical protein